jgi:hypothetical protein
MKSTCLEPDHIKKLPPLSESAKIGVAPITPQGGMLGYGKDIEF